MLPLANRTIALAEGRQLEELAQLLAREGATSLRCPMVSMLDPPDDTPVLAWLDRLPAFEWVILFTGEGVRRLVSCAERHHRRDAFVSDLAKCRTLTRGPKPGKALKEIGLAPTLLAMAPTTEGVIHTLRTLELRDKTVGVQLYSESNPPLMQYLKEAGAQVDSVQPYFYAPASDADHVVQLIQQLAAGQVDAIVFTSSPQIERLFDVAQERQLMDTLRRGLSQTQVASVGPLVNEKLHEHDVRVDISPEQGFVMKNLVQLIKRTLGRSE